MLKKIKSGFTLAETLIAMVVLGIILAFILPSLIATKPSESKLLYKKTFFTISEAIMAVVNNPDLYNTTEYNVLLNPIEKTTKNDQGNDITEKTNFCESLANYLNTVGEINCNDNNGTFKLANGVRINKIPKNFSDCTTTTERGEKYCTLIISTIGESATSIDSQSTCKKRTRFQINILENGKVYTDTGDNWKCENSILETGTKVQMDNDTEEP